MAFAAASNGCAARMPGNHTEWAIALPIHAVVSQQLHAATEPMGQGCTDATYCRVYAFVRCGTTIDLSDAEASVKPAMAVGIYDGQARKDVAYKVLTIAETAGSDYHLIDLGASPFTMITAMLHFLTAPANRPDAVTAVFVDRVVIVRQ